MTFTLSVSCNAIQAATVTDERYDFFPPDLIIVEAIAGPSDRAFLTEHYFPIF
jgi:hypothetical protein